MTITTDMTKADLIAAIGRALIAEGRTEEAATFYRLAAHARDVQEVMMIMPDGLLAEREA